jgi:hypothetical protein
VIYEVKIAVFVTQNCLPKGPGLQCIEQTPSRYHFIKMRKVKKKDCGSNWLAGVHSQGIDFSGAF